MKFYHGTTEEKWALIQKERVLFGIRPSFIAQVPNLEVDHDQILKGKGEDYCFVKPQMVDVIEAPQRCTYLALDKPEAMQYGLVILEVEYEPHPELKHDNYDPLGWQLRVYVPIEIEKIKRIPYR